MRMSNKTYNTLRCIVQIILPALATFLIAMSETWGIDILNNVGASITAVITLMSGILGASSAVYDKEKGDAANGNNN